MTITREGVVTKIREVVWSEFHVYTVCENAREEHGNKASYVSFTWSYCSANLEAVAGEVWNMWEGRKRRSLPAD